VLSVLVPGLLLVPVITPASAAPVPVAPGVVELALSGVDAAASAEPSGSGAPSLMRAAGTRRTVLLTTRRATADYGMVGVTWDGSRPVGQVEAWVRTRSSGSWSDWTPLGGASDEEPDAAEARGTRAGTAPLWVGQADGVQVRVDVLAGEAPTRVRVALVDPGSSAADANAAQPGAPRSAAHAAATAPPIRTRAQWGADESIRSGSPSYAPLKAVVVHHTASTNDYTAAQVPSLMRGFYAYHVKSRGWSDIGYNVLVDRFGTAWEGRAGGLDRGVIGAHAGGFNTGTVGVSMIGTYDTAAPSAAMLSTVAQVVAWKASAAGIDPRGTVRLTSAGSTRFAAGTAVTLPTVLGHRDVSTTSCPGVKGYAALPALRERAAALRSGAPAQATGLEVVAPSSAAAGTTAQLLVRGGAAGAEVEVFFRKRGEAGATLRRTGVLGFDGTYRTSYVVDDDYDVFAVSGGRATRPTTVRRSPALTDVPRAVAPAVVLEGPVTAPTGSTVLLTARGPAGADVSVWLRGEGAALSVLSRQGRLDATGRFSTSYTADRAYTWFARTADAASPEGATQLGPVPNGLDVTAPASVAAGGTVPVAVQGRPGQAVQLWFARGGERAFVLRREGVLGPDGMYRTSYLASADHTFFATSAGRSSTRRTTRTTAVPSAVPPPAPRLRMTVAPAVEAGAVVPVTVEGAPGAAVELWTRKRGAAVWTRSRVGSLGADGRWATTYVGVDDHDLWAASGGATSADASALVVPVLRGPASAPLAARVELTGRARPRDAVVVVSTRRSTGAVVRTALTADASGGFRTSYAADDEYEHRVTAAGRAGAVRRTVVAPTATGPARAGRGSTVVLSGTARPGGTVELLLQSTAAPDAGLAGRRARPLPLFRVGRTATADASGRWRTSFVLTAARTWFARADGVATTVRTTTVG